MKKAAWADETKYFVIVALWTPFYYNYSTKEEILRGIQTMSDEEVAAVASWVNYLNKGVFDVENKYSASAQSALRQKSKVIQDVMKMNGDKLDAVAQLVKKMGWGKILNSDEQQWYWVAS